MGSYESKKKTNIESALIDETGVWILESIVSKLKLGTTELVDGKIGSGVSNPLDALSILGNLRQVGPHNGHQAFRKFFTTSIPDATTTSVVRIHHPVPTAAAGGTIHATVRGIYGHSISSGTGAAAAKGFHVNMTTVRDAGNNGFSQVDNVVVGTTIGDSLAARNIGTTTWTVDVTSKDYTDLRLSIDLTGSSVSPPAYVYAILDLIVIQDGVLTSGEDITIEIL